MANLCLQKLKKGEMEHHKWTLQWQLLTYLVPMGKKREYFQLTVEINSRRKLSQENMKPNDWEIHSLIDSYRYIKLT